MRVRSAAVTLAVCVAVLYPVTAYAAAPPTSQREIVNVTVEPGAARAFDLVPTDGVSGYYWGPITNVKHAGSYSLWVAGKSYPSGAASGKFPTYPATTVGSAYLYLTELNDYYSATMSYWYLCPSRGAADGDSFSLTVLNTGPPQTLINRYPLSNVSAWTKKTYNLALPVNGQISRKPIDVQFRFTDVVEGGGIPVGNGQGPAIDDFVVTAYKYGPVRSLAVGQSGSNVRLTWLRPYRSLTETAEEERQIAYRVWRSVAGTNNWTELTTDRLANGSLSYDDPITTEGVAYEYYVQAWDPGTGADYGPAAKSGFVGAPAANPTITMTSPASPFALNTGPVTIAGTSSDTGSGVASVKIKLQRADGKFWAGSSWSATEVWLDPDVHAGDWSTWSTSWTPDSEIQGLNQVVTVTAKATDVSGRTASVSSYSDGAIAPAGITIARSAAVIKYKGSSRISGKVFSMDSPVVGKPVQLQYYSGGWRWRATRYTAGDGSVYFDVSPRDRTSYRLFFGASGYQPKATSYVVVTPRVYLGRPKKPSSARKNRTFTSSGYLKPRHSARTYPVKVVAYRYQKGKWVPRRTFKAKAYNYRTYTKYVAKVKLPYTGKWRLRAVAPTDSRHYETWSSTTKSFRVR